MQVLNLSEGTTGVLGRKSWLTGGDKGEVWGNTQILATRRPRRENPVLINLRDYKD